MNNPQGYPYIYSVIEPNVAYNYASLVDGFNVINKYLYPGIDLVKQANTATYELGDEITYTFTVTNTGNVELKDVVVIDPMFESIELESTVLLPNESTIGKAPYVVTQSDVDRGYILNHAITTGTPPSGFEKPVDDDEVKIDGPTPQPSVELIKEVNTQTYKLVDELTYTFTVTNTGNVTLTNVEVTDPMFSQITLEKTVLLPNESTLGKASYVVTQSDVDRGSILNHALVTGTTPSDTTVTSEDEVNIDGPTPQPSIELLKEVNTQTYKFGDKLTYTFTVTNTGNVILSNIFVTDPMFESIELENTVLLPNVSTVGSVLYVVTQSDVDGGSILNHALVTGTTPSDSTVTSEDEVEIVTTELPSLKFKKTVDKELVKVGETITYTFEIRNTGNVTLGDIVVSDPMFKEIILDKTSLKPNEVAKKSAQYRVTKEDEQQGSVVNKATVTTGNPDLDPVDSEVTVKVEKVKELPNTGQVQSNSFFSLLLGALGLIIFKKREKK